MAWEGGEVGGEDDDSRAFGGPGGSEAVVAGAVDGVEVVGLERCEGAAILPGASHNGSGVGVVGDIRGPGRGPGIVHVDAPPSHRVVPPTRINAGRDEGQRITGVR